MAFHQYSVPIWKAPLENGGALYKGNQFEVIALLRYGIDTVSALLARSSYKVPVMRNFYVGLNKKLDKQRRSLWFETECPHDTHVTAMNTNRGVACDLRRNAPMTLMSQPWIPDDWYDGRNPRMLHSE